MLAKILEVLAAAIFFYLAAPIAGAFRIRREWRRFRLRARDAFGAPDLSWGDVREGDAGPAKFRCFGRLEAIGEDDRLWLRHPGGTCVVDPGSTPVYLLPRCGSEPRSTVRELIAADEVLHRAPWRSLGAVSRESKVFVGGLARFEDGMTAFLAAEDGDGNRVEPFVVIHDGADADLERRLVWSGRHKNEYWNQFTQISIATGALASSVFVYRALSGPIVSFTAALVTVTAFAPLLPLLPPGVAFFILYRRSWRHARALRARRDLEDHPGGNARERLRCAAAARRSTIASAACFAAALGSNFFVYFLLLRWLLR